ncbi:MAG: HIT family protein [Candidatus Methylopumilus sp.]|jgi:diadenosine tetraphosphate (Ap4A) HIT family hydrolase
MGNHCELCASPGGELIWQDDFCRVVRVDDQDYPGFCRVILNKHIKEMSDLERAEQERLMSVVFAVEQAVRETMNPDKINLASLGNKTPHMHWHVIPRYAHDRHFPNPIWGVSKRERLANPIDSQTARALKSAIQKILD